MKKFMFTLFFMIFLIPFATAADSIVGTIVNGVVYEGKNVNTPSVNGAEITVECFKQGSSGSVIEKDVTDEVGFYAVVFDNADECPLGSKVLVTAEKGDAFGTTEGVVEDKVTNLFVLGLDVFNIPEFGLVTASLVFVIALGGFFVMRRKEE